MLALGLGLGCHQTAAPAPVAVTPPAAKQATDGGPPRTAPEDARKTPSGARYVVLKAGRGSTHPSPRALVVLRYTIWNGRGGLLERSESATELGLRDLAPGWAEAVEQMVVGERIRLWLPADLAAALSAASSGSRIIEVELVQIADDPPEPTLPIPDDAEETRTGLKYKVLRPGTGSRHPDANSSVRVHYTGWTLDGNEFDSSRKRGSPATFRLTSVIKGWTEGLQLMVAGEITRFWIPADLAYGNAPGGGRPVGLLIFDIELIEIE